MPFSLHPEKPFVPEATDNQGPAVEFWRQSEHNNDKRTDHDALMADADRRRRVVEHMLGNLDVAPRKPTGATE